MTKNTPIVEIDNAPLRRGEAMWVVDWLVKDKKKPAPKRGFYAALRLTPEQVAEQWKVGVKEVLIACRRIQPES